MTDMSSSFDQAVGAAPTAPTRIRVWDLPTRVFHWSLAASFAGAWLTAESERWRDVHIVLGYLLAGLIVFRLIWGVVGSRHARFASFAFPPSRVVGYLKSLFKGAPEHHAGHNPAGALAIFGLLALGLAAAASGYALHVELGGEWMEDLHEGAANAMLGLVVIHLAGVLVSSLLHRENLPRAMITGWKSGRPEEGIATIYPALGILLLLSVAGFLAFSQAPAGRALLFGAASSGPTGNAERTLDDDHVEKDRPHAAGKQKSQRAHHDDD